MKEGCRSALRKAKTKYIVFMYHLGMKRLNVRKSSDFFLNIKKINVLLQINSLKKEWLFYPVNLRAVK